MRLMNKLSEKLTEFQFIPWRMRHQGGPLNTLIQRPIRQKKLKSSIQDATKLKDEVTVIYGIRNRVDYKFWHSLNSVRLQDYDQMRIKILVVDYGSSESDLEIIRSFCAEFNAELLETHKTGDWNRAHCLNIGIKRTTTKILLTTDTDIIFSKNYLSVLVDTLKNTPLSVIFSRCLDLKESTAEFLISQFKEGQSLEPEELKSQAEGRSSGEANAGINASYTQFYQDIYGYDEYFKLWGSEDNDIKRRLEYFGLESRSIADKAYYIHQWHPKHDGVNTSPELKKTIEKNHQYFQQDHRIFKNMDDWGEY
jgi:hypothetical protein